MFIDYIYNYKMFQTNLTKQITLDKIISFDSQISTKSKKMNF